jgi:ribosomal protein S18 acetylase RimI-like enzyme
VEAHAEFSPRNVRNVRGRRKNLLNIAAKKTEVPMTPLEVEFEPMTGHVLAAWLGRSRTDYVAERTDSGDSAAEAEANAAAAHERLMPGGVPAPGQLIGHVCGPDGAVGHLWLGPAGTDPARWWVWDVAIEPEFRGRGFGRAAMELADRLARANGARTIGLNVFGRNTVARNLYASLGYEESAVVMRKDL